MSFNGGDVIDWPDSLWFRDPPDAWPAFLLDLWRRLAITDLVVYGDERPLHRRAIDLCGSLGTRCHVFEEGYLRPDWITLEATGVNRNSPICRLDDTSIRQAAARQPSPAPVPVGPVRSAQAYWCVRHYLAWAALSPAFPHHQSHRPEPIRRELGGWSRRLVAGRLRSGARRAVLARFLDDPAPFFLVALQLDSDSQIRCHAGCGDMRTFLSQVVASFAAYAPAPARLLVKLHPLDNGLVDFGALTAKLATRHDLVGRLGFVDGGRLPTLLRRARGVVTANSTVGLQAIHHGTPTAALAPAVYNRPGLVDPGPLDRFWTSPIPPDRDLYSGFRRTLIAFCQWNGSFFTTHGRQLLVEPLAEVLGDGWSDKGESGSAVPPRLRVRAA